MPARTYRLQVPVSPETRTAINRYAEAMGISPARAAEQMLEQVAPSLLDLAAAMEKAKQAPAKGVADMAKALNKAAEKADQMALDLTPKATRKRKKTG